METITEFKNLIYPSQAESNIKAVFQKQEITTEDKNIFCDSLKFLIYGEFNQMNNEPKTKPSINFIYSLSGLSKNNGNDRIKMYRVLKFAKENRNLTIGDGLHIKSKWANLSNGQQIKQNIGTRAKYISNIA